MQKSSYEEFLDWKENLIKENKESFIEYINNFHRENEIRIPLPYFHVVEKYYLEDIKYLREIEFEIYFNNLLEKIKKFPENYTAWNNFSTPEEDIKIISRKYHFTQFSLLSDAQIESLYKEWSQDNYCASWLSMSEVGARNFIKWATTTPCERVKDRQWN